jgi:hypothetical protein
VDWTALPALIADVGPVVGVVLVIGILIARGAWVPRAQVDTLLAMKDQIIASERLRADEWKAATQAEREARQASDEQIADLLEQFEVHTVLLRAIQDAAAGKRSA